MAILCDRCEGSGREVRGLDLWACDACDGKGFVSEHVEDGICDGCAQSCSECLCGVDLDDVLDCNHPSHPGCRQCESKEPS